MRRLFSYKPYRPNAIILSNDSTLELPDINKNDTIFSEISQPFPSITTSYVNQLHLFVIKHMMHEGSQKLFKDFITYLTLRKSLYFTQEIIFHLSLKRVIDTDHNQEYIIAYVECIRDFYLRGIKSDIAISFYITDLDYLCGFQSYKKFKTISALIIDSGLNKKSNVVDTIVLQLRSLIHEISTQMIEILDRTDDLHQRLQLYILPSQLQRLNQPLSKIGRQLQQNMKSLYPRHLKNIYLDERSICRDQKPLINPFYYHLFLIKKYALYILISILLLLSLLLFPLSLAKTEMQTKSELNILQQPIDSIYRAINLYQYRQRLKFSDLKSLTLYIKHYIDPHISVYLPHAMLSIHAGYLELINAYQLLNQDTRFAKIKPILKMQLLASLNHAWQHHTDLEKFQRSYIDPLDKIGVKSNLYSYKQYVKAIEAYKSIKKLSITPINLSNAVAKVGLHLGSEVLTYQHGPESQSIIMLDSENLSPCYIEYNLFDQRQYIDNFSSEYCLAHLLKSSHYQHSQVMHCHSKHICFSFKIDYAIYKKLNLINTTFKTPNKITLLGG